MSLKNKRPLWEMYARHFKLSVSDLDRLFPHETTDLLFDRNGRKCCRSGKTSGALVFVPKSHTLDPGNLDNIVLIAKNLASEYLSSLL